MAFQTVRPLAPDPREPTLHLLPPIRIAGQTIQMSLTIRQDENGVWRGRLQFVDGEDAGPERRTAEIFCGASEDELWSAVHRLRDHHIHALYRSLDPTDR